MKKLAILLVFVSVLFSKLYGQGNDESEMSLALGSGFGFRDIHKMNGGAYAENTAGNTAGIGHDFSYAPLYWSAAFAAKYKRHEFGIEFEKLKYTSNTTATGYNVSWNVESTLKFTYFNLYYKYHLPFEYKNFTPYLKGGLNTNIYVYHRDSQYKNTLGSPGTDNSSTAGAHFSFCIMGGVNYRINNSLSAFTELGFGSVICKLGVRFSFLKEAMKK